jgi:hypothetical protein
MMRVKTRDQFFVQDEVHVCVRLVWSGLVWRLQWSTGCFNMDDIMEVGVGAVGSTHSTRLHLWHAIVRP